MSEPVGFLNVNKPVGMTSRRIVDDVTYLFRTGRVGHAGTLDPMASGVLVVAVGKATRLVPHVQDQPKTYLATFELGATSNTDDLEGEIVREPGRELPSQSTIEACLPEFVGRIQQVPPLFSAVHVDGRRAYHLARKNREFEIPPRPVEVFQIDMLRYEPPFLSLRIMCGSGTYIRSIGRDLGARLGCGGLMSGLVREQIGPLKLDAAVDLKQLTRENAAAVLLPMTVGVALLPQHVVSEADLIELQCGRQLTPPPDFAPKSFPVALLAPDRSLAALAEWDTLSHRLHPRQVFLEHCEGIGAAK